MKDLENHTSNRDYVVQRLDFEDFVETTTPQIHRINHDHTNKDELEEKNDKINEFPDAKIARKVHFGDDIHIQV